MKKVNKEASYHLCPHSAIGVHAYFEQCNNDTDDGIGNTFALQHDATVCVLTAHPAKFDETLIQAGITPCVNKAVEHLRSLPNDKFKWLHANGKKSTEKIFLTSPMTSSKLSSK